MPPKKSAKKPKYFSEEPEKKDDLSLFAKHAQEHPWHYLIAIGFIAACLVAGVLYRSHVRAVDREAATAYMRALEVTEPKDRLAKLEPLAQDKNSMTPEILFVLGETALEAKDNAKAKEAFERVRKEFPESQFTPDAVEALGAILEAQDPPDYEGARLHYEEVMNTWPDSFAAVRQPYNAARCLEKQEKYEAAIGSYRSQIGMFPGSNIARDAQAALDRLRVSKPEFFKNETAPAASTSSETPPATSAAPETAPAVQSQTETPPAATSESPIPKLELKLREPETTENAQEGAPLEVPKKELEIPAAPAGEPGTPAPAEQEAAPPAEVPKQE